jgi:hypothetical protein
MKEGSIGKPTRYLRASVLEYTLPGDTKQKWAFPSNQYVEEAIRNIEIELHKSNYVLVTTVQTPLLFGYCP